MDDSLAQLVADLQERVGALGFELADVQRRGAARTGAHQCRNASQMSKATPGRTNKEWLNPLW